MVPRITITEAAQDLVNQLKASHGPLIFHQSGGCCDGSAPMCFPEGELFLNETDVCLGEVAGCKFYMSQDQFKYWEHTQLQLDVVAGRGASFSLEIPLGLRFLTRSRMYTEAEAADLTPVSRPE